jgi:hypothetical protein
MTAWPHLLIQGPDLGPRDLSMYTWRSRARHPISSLSVIHRTPYTPWIFTVGHQPTQILRGPVYGSAENQSFVDFPSLHQCFFLHNCSVTVTSPSSIDRQQSGLPFIRTSILVQLAITMRLVFIVTLTASGTTARLGPTSSTREKAVGRQLLLAYGVPR